MKKLAIMKIFLVPTLLFGTLMYAAPALASDPTIPPPDSTQTTPSPTDPGTQTSPPSTTPGGSSTQPTTTTTDPQQGPSKPQNGTSANSQTPVMGQFMPDMGTFQLLDSANYGSNGYEPLTVLGSKVELAALAVSILLFAAGSYLWRTSGKNEKINRSLRRLDATA